MLSSYWTNTILIFRFKLLDTRVLVLVDTVGSGVSVDVGQLGVLDQHRQAAVGQAARQTDNHDQSETRGGQGTGAVVQSPEVGRRLASSNVSTARRSSDQVRDGAHIYYDNTMSGGPSSKRLLEFIRITFSR